jgi:hypothetical protein
MTVYDGTAQAETHVLGPGLPPRRCQQRPRVLTPPRPPGTGAFRRSPVSFTSAPMSAR